MPDLETEDLEGGVRAFWSGTITFGLVTVPVALYAANRSAGIHLRMVSPEGTPLNRRYFTSKDDRPLDADDIVRGYEIEKGRFVIVDDEELERLAPERTRDIDLRQFVKADEIDPMYFERAYYLTPAGGSNKAYRLLARVMEETGRAGIATFVMRAKEYLVAIIAENGILRAETLRFADELRKPEDVGLPEPADVKDAAVRRIDREIGKLAEGSLPQSELEDRSRERLMKVIRAKLRSHDDVVQAPPEERDEQPADVVDLMAILKARLQGQGEDAAADAAPARKRTPAKASSSSRPKPASTASKKPSASRKTASKSGSSKTASKSASKSTSKSGSKTASKSGGRKSSSKAKRAGSKS